MMNNEQAKGPIRPARLIDQQVRTMAQCQGLCNINYQHYALGPVRLISLLCLSVLSPLTCPPHRFLIRALEYREYSSLPWFYYLSLWFY